MLGGKSCFGVTVAVVVLVVRRVPRMARVRLIIRMACWLLVGPRAAGPCEDGQELPRDFKTRSGERVVLLCYTFPMLWIA